MNITPKLPSDEIVFICYTLFIFIAGILVGAGIAYTDIRNQAVSKELAYYHPKTKAFTWIDKE